MVVTKFSVLGARVFWFLVGPIALLFTLAGMVDSGRAGLSGLDALFAFFVSFTVYCRWVEQRSGEAATAEGKPATWADFRAYALIFPLVAGTAWLLTKVVIVLT